MEWGELCWFGSRVGAATVARHTQQVFRFMFLRLDCSQNTTCNVQRRARRSRRFTLGVFHSKCLTMPSVLCPECVHAERRPLVALLFIQFVSFAREAQVPGPTSKPKNQDAVAFSRFPTRERERER